MNLILAGGGVVWRKGSSDVEFLIVHRPRYDDWTFPKGKLDGSESVFQAAYREVVEETGYQCRIGPKLPTTEYTTGNGNGKAVHYWAMEAVKGSFSPNDEVDKAEWLAASDAIVRLTYEHDRRLVSDLPKGFKKMPDRLWFVRHADAGDRSAWKDDDRRRPLSDKGLAQSKAIGWFLRHQATGQLVSSPFERCMATLHPLAKKTGKKVERHESLEEGVGAKKTVALLRELPAGSVLSSHGDVIPAALDRAVKAGLELKSPFECKKGSICMIHRKNGELRSATYLPPPDV